MPLVRATTIVAIVQEWDRLGSPPGGWMAPVLSETCAAEDGSPTARYGHPVVIGAALAAAVQSLAPDEPLRALRAQATRLLAAQVDDRAILDDLDTREDLAALRGRLREER